MRVFKLLVARQRARQMCYTAESVTGGVTTEADTSRIFDVSGDVADDHVPLLDDLLDASITAPEANLVSVSEPAPLLKTPVKVVAFAEPAVVAVAAAGPSGSVAPTVRRGLKLPTFDSAFRRPGFQKARRTPAEQKKASERQNKLRAKASSHARKFLTRDPTPRTPTPVLQSVTAIGTPVFSERDAEPSTSFHVPLSCWRCWLQLGRGVGGGRAPGLFSGRERGTRRQVEFFGVRAGAGHGPEQGLQPWTSGAGREEEGLEP